MSAQNNPYAERAKLTRAVVTGGKQPEPKPFLYSEHFGTWAEAASSERDPEVFPTLEEKEVLRIAEEDCWPVTK